MRDLSMLAAKLESVPGTAESPTSSDVLVRLREGDAPSIPIELVDTQEIQEFSSSRPSKPGPARFQASASWVLRPSGTPASVAPACALLLQMGLLKQEAVKEIAIGAVTSGPYADGEAITGGISGATGIVFRPCSSTPLRYYPVTGTFVSGERITSSGGAYADSTGTPASKGFLYRLVDSDFVGGADSKHHATVNFLRGGYFWKGRGVLGELAFEFRNNLHCIVRSSMLGALEDFGDLALYSLASYPDEGIAEPRFVNASLLLDAYSPSDVVDFNLSIPLGLELREDANTTTGLRFCDYERRGAPPTITFEPAMVSKATYDFFTKLRDGTTFSMTWRLGTAPAFTFFADECQLVSAGIGNRRSLATVPIQVRLCGRRNNELQIWANG